MEVIAEMKKQEGQQPNLVDLAAAKDWQIGEVRFFKRATGEDDRGRYYLQKEGFGFANAGGTEYFFNAADQVLLEAGGDDFDLTLEQSPPSKRVVDLSSGNQIVVIEIGLGRKGIAILKWCLPAELEEAANQCHEASNWRFVHRRPGEEDEVYWKGNNLSAFERYIEKESYYLSRFHSSARALENIREQNCDTELGRALRASQGKQGFDIELQLEDGTWEVQELNALPAELQSLCLRAGFAL